MRHGLELAAMEARRVLAAGLRGAPRPAGAMEVA